MKVTHRGLLPPDDPIYQQGWTLYMGPQPKRRSETLSKDTPPENSESTTPSEKAAAENPPEEGEKT
jgi:hypothetical protein